MTVSTDELAAYADGQLSGEAEARVAAAIAADPALGARLEAEQRLRATLKRALDPVLDEPVPEDLTLMIAAFAADEMEADMTDALPPHEPAPVLDLAVARRKREAARAATRWPAWPGWPTGGAIAASLVLGVLVGTQFAANGPVTQKDGKLVASGALAKGLETQLAAADDGDLKIFASFQRGGGDFCRAFDDGSTSGIACKNRGDWVLERTFASGGSQASEYRQAGSSEGELMTAAQAMAKGDALDPAQEKAAQARGWHP